MKTPVLTRSASEEFKGFASLALRVGIKSTLRWRGVERFVFKADVRASNAEHLFVEQGSVSPCGLGLAAGGLAMLTESL